MSREKQIEEMAKVMNECCNRYDDQGNHIGNKCYECEEWSDDNHCCCSYNTKEAEALYNAGYRKQSENTVVLPCNIGDSCYPLPRSRKPIVERKVSRITFSKRNVIIGYYENDGQYRPPLRTRVLGEDVFLTKEEAEAKMKGEKNNGTDN